MAFAASLRGGRQTHMGKRPVDTMPQTSAGRTVTHANVQEALVAILADMPAVGKNQRAPQVMGGYAFRGIDDVLNVLNPLLAKHGVFYTPEVLERIDGNYTYSKDGKDRSMWTVKLHVQYTFHHAESALLVTTTVWGEAHDSGDKATQKALTAAQKSMLFQVFAINTADQADSDSERHEAEEAVPERPYMSGMNVKRFIDSCVIEECHLPDRDKVVSKATGGRTINPEEVFADEVTVLRAAFESWQAEHQKVAPSASKKAAKKVAEVETVRLDEESGEYVTDVKHDGTLV